MADARQAKEVQEFFLFDNRERHQNCARFVNGRRVVLLRSALVPRTVGLISVVLIVQSLTCSPARVATTVTRDSRNTCRRWNAVCGGCSCDMASAVSDAIRTSLGAGPMVQPTGCCRRVGDWSYARSSKRCGACVVLWRCAATKYGGEWILGEIF